MMYRPAYPAYEWREIIAHLRRTGESTFRQLIETRVPDDAADDDLIDAPMQIELLTLLALTRKDIREGYRP